MIYVSDVQKAAAAYAQDLKENSAEYGLGSGSPRKVRCMSCMPGPKNSSAQATLVLIRIWRDVSRGSQLLCPCTARCSRCSSNILGRCQSIHWLLHDLTAAP